MTRIVRGCLIFAVLAGIGFGSRMAYELHQRPEGNPGSVEVHVPRGISGRELVRRLETLGLAEQPDLVYWTLRGAGAFKNLRAGTYLIPGTATPLDLVNHFMDPSAVKPVQLTLIPGESTWHASRNFEQAGIMTADDLLALGEDYDYVAKELNLPVGPKRTPRADGIRHTYLEGFFFPDTYFFSPEMPAKAVISRVAETFTNRLAALRERSDEHPVDRKKSMKLDDHQVVVLASLIEREVKVPEEAALVAGVFINRLRAKMPLQTDPSLVYHPARLGHPPTPEDRKNSDNPYNTYANKGLPPGPICSPGIGSLKAALQPASHRHLFFVAKRDGSGRHVFSDTYPQHLKNVRTYLLKEESVAAE